MASARWPCLLGALHSSSVAFVFPRSPSRPLEVGPTSRGPSIETQQPGRGPQESASYQPPSNPYYVDGDPHFIIQVRGNKDAICFNIDEEPGTVLCLIQDPITGQFFRPLAFKVSDFNPGNDHSKIHATMLVKKHRLAVTRGYQKDSRKDVHNGTHVGCWFVHNN